MYISDKNYDQAIENLEDCMFALKSMDQQIGRKGHATSEDIAYMIPRFEESLRYILSLTAHRAHQDKFQGYIKDQQETGTDMYEALNIGYALGSIVEHFEQFLLNMIHSRKKGGN